MQLESDVCVHSGEVSSFKSHVFEKCSTVVIFIFFPTENDGADMLYIYTDNKMNTVRGLSIALLSCM